MGWDGMGWDGVTLRCVVWCGVALVKRWRNTYAMFVYFFVDLVE